MKSTISATWSLLIVCIVGAIASSIIIFFPSFDLSAQNSDVRTVLPIINQNSKNLNNSTSTGAVLGVDFPGQASEPADQTVAKHSIRLKIPKINVDVAVESVGLTPDGAMVAPKGAMNVAWYNLGPRPGEVGSAVITGHYGRWKNGEVSVFDNLNKLEKGDKIYIQDAKGMVITFVVQELRMYQPDEDASGVFSSSDGKVHLNLITCAGEWDKNQQSYSSRLVVFTDKEIE